MCQEPARKKSRMDKGSVKDEENYIAYRPKDDKSERG